MWGRQGHHIALCERDRAVLERIVRSGRSQQRLARRARILLAMADPAAMVDEIAEALGVARTTVWRVCRRYESRGLAGLHDDLRSGRPRLFPPLGPGANRAVGVLRTQRYWFAVDPLVDAQPGPSRGGARHRGQH